MQERPVDFQALKLHGVSPQEGALQGEAAGLSRLEVLKGVHLTWGDEFFDLGSVELVGAPHYPSEAARAAATVGLAAIVLSYPDATYGEVEQFEAITGISRKVEALAQANRVEEALGFYDRLVPGALSLRPISKDAAKKEVGAAVDKSVRPVAPQASMIEHQWGWLFCEQSGEVLQRQCLTFFDRFVGAAIVVSGNPDECVARYERTGWPVPIQMRSRES